MTRIRFHQELDELKHRILAMAGMSEQAIDLAVQAYSQRDPALCQRVLSNEDAINRAEREVDEFAIDLLAMQQPMAVDLRFILAVIKINADLERVGEIDELKEGLQLVIAVGAPARHMEKEIQLGGRGPARVAAGRHGCQSSTRSRTRTASRLSVNRAGSISAPTAT